ncbi:MAG: metallophosphoesterase [Woeseia sp.]
MSKSPIGRVIHSSPFVQFMLLASLLLQGACANSAEVRATGVERVVAISDVHGAFDAMQRALQQAGVIDTGGQWTGGKTHLVVTGDIVDRGPESRAAMDLLMRLEPAAAAAGGQVHVLLGNHEVMNLVGDLRYVSSAEYAAFADEELPAERERWRQAFIKRATAFSSEDVLSEQFARAHPPGFFAHRRAFAADGAYGKWLLSKPLLIVLNDTAFVHGGLAPRIAEFGLDGVNAAMKKELTDYVAAVAVLNDAGLLHPGDSFYAHRKILDAAGDSGSLPQAAADAIKTVLAEAEFSIHDQDGPLWYRGNIICSPLTEQARIQPVLDALGARRVVVGHTPTVSRDVVTRLGGKVIEIDTGMLNAYYNGSGHALVLEGSDLAVVDEQGGRSQILPDPRPNGHGAMRLADIEDLLQTGEVLLGEKRSDGSYPAQVKRADTTLDAVFIPAKSKKASPDVAAYRLDRMLELQAVPPTVRRELNGRDGALQLRPENNISEDQRIAKQLGGGAWCPLQAQWDAMFVFDALIQNEVRAQKDIQYSRESWQMFLTNHYDAFGTGRNLPRYLKDVPLDVNDAWRAALQSLDEQRLQQLEDVLDSRQLRALLKRRDTLLER